MAKPRESIRLFENDLLERLSHVHPITPLIVWVPVVGYLFYRSFDALDLSVAQVAASAASGLFVWTLVEYLLHRYVFHYRSSNAFVQRLHFIIHGNHHEDPQDPTRLVMPPVAGAIIAAVLFALFRVVLGPTWVEPFFAGFLLGYLAYDYTHYAVHHFKPRTAWGKRIKHNHMLHHFQFHDALWGVSSPLWDHVFGTLGGASERTRRRSEGRAS